MARYFLENREEVLVASAAALAEKTDTSDATVVRTAKALGFAGLDALRRALADEIRIAVSPADRLTRTLGEVGDSLSAAFTLTLDIHMRALEGLRHSITDELFRRAVDGIVDASRIAVFGLGPSSAIAGYFATQLTRFGFDVVILSNTGLLFADDLQKLREGDLVIMLAYGQGLCGARRAARRNRPAQVAIDPGDRYPRHHTAPQGRPRSAGRPRPGRHAEHAHRDARFS